MLGYFQAAPREDVWIEQFSYLMDHAEDCEIEDCPECSRGRDVQALLMRPFETVAFGREFAKTAEL